MLARWFAEDELRSEISEEDEGAAASLLRYLNHQNGVYLHRSMPPGYYCAGVLQHVDGDSRNNDIDNLTVFIAE